MPNWLRLVLATVLVCSLPAAAISGGIVHAPDGRWSDSSLAVDGSDADWLSPSNDSLASGSSRIDVGASVALDNDAARLDSRYRQYRIDARLEGANADATRREILREEAARLSDAATALHERERRAYTAYHAGDIGERELVIELAAVHARAVAIEHSVAALSNHAENVSGLSLDRRLETTEVKAATLQGPVRKRAAAMLRGGIEPTPVQVTTDGNGVVLATITNGQFYREAYRADNRNPDGAVQLENLGETEDRIATLYPEIAPEARWSYSEMGYATHRAVGNYSEGSITVYLDQATAEAYREHRTLNLERVETVPIHAVTQDGVELAVSGTVPGGPARITLVDAATGAPVSGEITVDGRTVETAADGEVWIVMPRGSTTITASTGSATVETTVNASSTP